ncbi:MAG: sulfatase-like hydrolase/transferase [Planctomycetota bacterium]
MSQNLAQLSCIALSIVAILFHASLTHAQDEQPVPNILWLTIEDSSAYEFGCYGNTHVKTPNIDALAAKGVRFTNASSVAPQCSPARSTLISGVFATTYGTGLHRGVFPSPKERPFLPRLMRQAGYYCLNVTKRDYNTPSPKNLWHQGADYSKSQKPFFAVYNNTDSHMKSVRKEALPASDIDISHLPYLPNLPEIRANYAAHLGKIRAIDQWVGRKLAELKDSGKQDDTIIFFFSDHGGCQPRGKAFAYETGLRVPLIIYLPPRWQHLSGDLEMASVSDRLVGFEDFAPTVLSLIGQDAPEQVQGKAFMGKNAQAPKAYQFGFRNNQGHHFDPVRTVRDKRYKYIRHYAPHKPLGMRQAYQWGMGANMAYDLANLRGELAPKHAAFFKAKPTEMLFDLKNDPWEMNNLANSPDHQQMLDRMRAKLSAQLRETIDLGFFLRNVRHSPNAASSPSLYDRVRESQYPLDELHRAAEIASLGEPLKVPILIDFLASEHPSIRFWAASGFSTLGSMGHQIEVPKELAALLMDDNEDVVAAAAEALCYLNRTKEGLRTLVQLIEKGNQQACSALEGYMKQSESIDQIKPYLPKLKMLASGTKATRQSVRFQVRSILLECGPPQTPFDLYIDRPWE